MHIHFGAQSAFDLVCRLLLAKRCYKGSGICSVCSVCSINPGQPCKCHLYEYKGIFIPNACKPGEFGTNTIRPTESNNIKIISISMTAPSNMHSGMSVLLTLGILNGDNVTYLCNECVCMGLYSFTMEHLSPKTRSIIATYAMTKAQPIIRIDVDEGALWGFYHYSDQIMYLHYIAITTIENGVKSISYKYFTDFPGLLIK